MNLFTLYWVALMEQDRPVQLVAGPFFLYADANEDAFLRTHAGARYGVVSFDIEVNT